MRARFCPDKCIKAAWTASRGARLRDLVEVLAKEAELRAENFA